MGFNFFVPFFNFRNLIVVFEFKFAFSEFFRMPLVLLGELFFFAIKFVCVSGFDSWEVGTIKFVLLGSESKMGFSIIDICVVAGVIETAIVLFLKL